MIDRLDIASALGDLGVEPEDTVLVHAGLQGSMRVSGRSAEEKLETVLHGLLSAVGDGTLIMPTFTYSFCEGEPFDLAESPSTSGVLSERFRRLPGVRRTADPIFSCAVRGELPPPWDERLLEIRDTDCFGPESVFAYLLEADATLLFLGVGFEYCTFLHRVEQELEVPYRYPKEFRGKVLRAGEEREVMARYLVRDLSADVETFFTPLAERLSARGMAREARLPRGPRLFAARAAAVRQEAVAAIEENPDFLLRRGHAGSVAEPSRAPGPAVP